MLRCPICARSSEADFVESHNTYKIYACPVCGGQFSWPLDYAQDNYNQWYKNESASSVSYKSYVSLPENKIIDSYLNAAPTKIALKFIKRLKGCKKLLDIGCSQGAFCKIAEGLGLKVYGVDPSEEAVEYASKKLNLTNVVSGSFKDIPEGWRNFDIITCFEVLEHIIDPRELALWAFSLLKPGGYFLVSVPNNKSLDVLLGKRSRLDFPPIHLTRWEKGTLKFLLREAGFSGIAIKNNPVDRLLVGMIISRDLILERCQLLGLRTIANKEDTSAARRLAPLWPLGQLLGDLCAFILNLFFFNHGGTLVALAQKPQEPYHK